MVNMDTNSPDLIPHSQPMLGAAEIKKTAEVIGSGQIAQGRMVAEFETAIADRMGIHSALAVSSGTAALHMTLVAMGIAAGDEVIMPSFVCSALLHAVSYVGAAPVLAEIDPVTYCMDPGDVKNRITARTRAIIVPHIFGRAADLNALLAFGVPLIEDCAQSTGGSYAGRSLGSFGHAAIFSFYATKVMTTGEGGMIVTGSHDLFERLYDLRDYDNKDDYHLRFNYKMTDLQAALGLCQLERLPEFIGRRRQIAAQYNRSLAELPLRLPRESSDHIFYRYVIDAGQDVTPLIETLYNKGVACTRPVYKPLHRFLNLKGYPKTDNAWRNSLSVPLYPALSDRRVDIVCSALIDAFKGK